MSQLRSLTTGAAAVLVALTGACAAAPQEESTSVVIRLGVDTVAVEQWVHRGDSLNATLVTRSPNTVVRRLTLYFGGDGQVTHYAVARDGAERQEREVEPAGAVPVVGGFYAPYAVLLGDVARRGDDAATVTTLVGQVAEPIEVRRAEDGAFVFPNQFGAEMRARLDGANRLVSIDAGGGSAIERVDRLDVEALAREFAARDDAGTGLGPLSPSETVETDVAGAAVSIEYGRPAARGRTVMGGLVPYGEVWRTGANAETRLTTDRPIVIGDLRLEPGTYSIFTIPERESWTLIVNRQTGQGGLGYDAAQDVGRTPMRVTALDSPVERFTILVEPTDDGGLLRLQWERTEASTPIRPAR